jgi:hypothetical protein
MLEPVTKQQELRWPPPMFLQLLSLVVTWMGLAQILIFSGLS